MDMYVKCGEIENVINVFKSMVKKDLIFWNIIIGGLVMYGYVLDVLDFFDKMKNGGLIFDMVIFIGVFCVCIYMGLVDKGFIYFYFMDNYNIRF